MELVKIGSPLELFTRNMFTQIIQRLSVFLADSDFSISEIAALHLIDKSPGIMATDLAKRLNLSISAVSRLLAGLERGKLIRRKAHKQDTRIKGLSCTRLGKELLDEMSLERVKAAVDVLEALPSVISKQYLLAIKSTRKADL